MPHATTAAYPPAIGGASLMVSFRMRGKATLIIGADHLAASRAFAALEAGSRVIVLVAGGLAAACPELRWRAEQQQLTILDWDTLPAPSWITSSSAEDIRIAALDALIAHDFFIALVCVTDTLLSSPSSRPYASAARIHTTCTSRRVPVNVADHPALCDVTFPSTHRFVDHATGEPTPLQLAVSASERGCRIAGRIRREAVARLPREVGGAMAKVAMLRDLAKAEDTSGSTSLALAQADTTLQNGGIGPAADDSEEASASTPNRPVPSRVPSGAETRTDAARRRMKWVAQVSEYWALERLAALREDEMRAVLSGEDVLPSLCSTPPAPGTSATPEAHPSTSTATAPSSPHSLVLSPPPTAKPKKGRILLVGSGPGHPALLTIATRDALMKHADLVLSDKLVPAAVLALIPAHIEVRIARKFPGNAEGAQRELMDAAVEGARRGLCVVRLKQGDVTVYARASEEVFHFRAAGFEPLLIPGVSSALAAPTMAGMPVTQRGVAESFVVCTAVSRAGRKSALPPYVRSRTLVILMGVARLPEVLRDLRERDDGAEYPGHLPIAIIERGSMPDQRAIVSTLEHIQEALESAGEQRPPGMMLVGWAAFALEGSEEVNVLDDDVDSGAVDGKANGDIDASKAETRDERDKQRISTDHEACVALEGGHFLMISQFPTRIMSANDSDLQLIAEVPCQIGALHSEGLSRSEGPPLLPPELLAAIFQLTIEDNNSRTYGVAKQSTVLKLGQLSISGSVFRYLLEPLTELSLLYDPTRLPRTELNQSALQDILAHTPNIIICNLGLTGDLKWPDHSKPAIALPHLTTRRLRLTSDIAMLPHFMGQIKVPQLKTLEIDTVAPGGLNQVNTTIVIGLLARLISKNGCQLKELVVRRMNVPSKMIVRLLDKCPALETLVLDASWGSDVIREVVVRLQVDLKQASQPLWLSRLRRLELGCAYRDAPLVDLRIMVETRASMMARGDKELQVFKFTADRALSDIDCENKVGTLEGCFQEFCGGGRLECQTNSTVL
ncbi:hypothetical protein CONPUDRAFT_141493 [Coniophora puteana RWD-64-598 SS2]|uniref:Uroporphyrin-III C-methyltransferase n=1 Tax=Coniophora puteana (strain RWD-64-598) TaxID=741705 RepID=A0A5M3N7D1_CONPW|nr:uncharacterized protein CONPUDRAFT_141493 [Coniophora puteana RWD-64-598 SS2]EIW87343.1 hypothetical protein CONPUDRAFT_141493 [Coniophora puteana RWD-64-598 SS2]